MDKLGPAVVGVVEFFAALLPGIATLAVLLFVAAKHDDVLALGEAGYVLFFVAAYLVGQVLSSGGSLVLDPLYDLFFDPEDGWLTRVRLDEKGAAHPSKAPVQKLSPSEIVTRVYDAFGDLPLANAYQRARAYLLLTAPAAFADVERREAEQKMWRSIVVAAVVLLVAQVVSVCFGRAAHVVVIAGSALTIPLALVRFFDVRRKTTERAYLYFELSTKLGRRSA